MADTKNCLHARHANRTHSLLKVHITIISWTIESIKMVIAIILISTNNVINPANSIDIIMAILAQKKTC